MVRLTKNFQRGLLGLCTKDKALDLDQWKQIRLVLLCPLALPSRCPS
jgi:hypothetical protein